MPDIHPTRRSRGFTLTELLIVIGIIGLLIAILVPVLGRVRSAGQGADTQSFVAAIDAAIQAYQQDHGAFPGPIPNDRLGPGIDSEVAMASLPNTNPFFQPTGNLIGVTGAENLVLGLMGGLQRPTGTGGVTFNPEAVNRGPIRLGGSVPRVYNPYLQPPTRAVNIRQIGESDQAHAAAPAAAAGRQWGRFVDDHTAAADTVVPELLDRYTDPLPILYYRAVGGRQAVTGTGVPTAMWDVNHNVAYTQAQTNGQFIGIGRLKLGNPHPETRPHGLHTGPAGDIVRDNRLTANTYFAAPGGGPRRPDGYILISAGRDRVYGTVSDHTNFGELGQ